MSRAPKNKAHGNSRDDQPELYIQNMGRPIPEDTVPDGCIGLRHVEVDQDPRLFPHRKFALNTEIFLYWNGPTPEDYLVIDERNVNDPLYILRMRKENIIPDWATTYCTVEEPGEEPFNSNELRLRIKLNRPAFPAPPPVEDGNRLLVVWFPEDIEAGVPITLERAQQGIILNVQPYANMAEYDTCRFVWGPEEFKHVVKPQEVSRGFNVIVPLKVVVDAGSHPYMPFAMQVIDAAGNYPASDPGSGANFSPTKWLTVDLGTRLLEAPFLQQPGNVIDLARRDNSQQKVLLFLAPDVFDKGDRVRLDWLGKDTQNVSIPYSAEQIVKRNNSFMEFIIPGEKLKATSGGIAILSCSLQKLGAEQWFASQTTLIRVVGATCCWQSPRVLEAAGGHLPPDIPKATVVIVAPDEWDGSVQVRLVWVGESTSYTQEYTLIDIPEDRTLVFNVESQHLKRFDTQHTELYYERADHSPSRESPRLQLQVGEPASSIPQARVETSKTKHKVTVVLPFTETQVGDILTLQWIGKQSRATIPITLDAGTAGREVHVPVSVAKLKKGEYVRVYYSLLRSGQRTRYSQLFVWQKNP